MRIPCFTNHLLSECAHILYRRIPISSTRKNFLILFNILLLSANILHAKTLSYYDGRFSFNLPEDVRVVSQNQDGCLFQAVNGDCHVSVRHYNSESLDAKNAVQNGDKFLFPYLKECDQTRHEESKEKRPDKAKMGYARYTDSSGNKPRYYESFTFVKGGVYVREGDIVCILVMSDSGDFAPARSVIDAFQFGALDLKKTWNKVLFAVLNAIAPFLYILYYVILLLFGEVIFVHISNRDGWQSGITWLAFLGYFTLSALVLLGIQWGSTFFWVTMGISYGLLLLNILSAYIPAMRRSRQSVYSFLMNIIKKSTQ